MSAHIPFSLPVLPFVTSSAPCRPPPPVGHLESLSFFPQDIRETVQIAVRNHPGWLMEEQWRDAGWRAGKAFYSVRHLAARSARHVLAWACTLSL
jgi:hypothetical protein